MLHNFLIFHAICGFIAIVMFLRSDTIKEFHDPVSEFIGCVLVYLIGIIYVLTIILAALVRVWDFLDDRLEDLGVLGMLRSSICLLSKHHWYALRLEEENVVVTFCRRCSVTDPPNIPSSLKIRAIALWVRMETEDMPADKFVHEARKMTDTLDTVADELKRDGK